MSAKTARDRAKIMLCGAIGKAQRGRPWTDDHPSEIVDEIIQATIDEIISRISPKVRQ